MVTNSFYSNFFVMNEFPYKHDDFTIPLGEVTTVIMMVVMGILSYYKIRRWNYDFFYHMHHFFVVVFIVMLWHAVS